MMRAQQSFGAGLILTIGGVCKGCHHRPSCRPIIIITRNNSNTERRDPALKHLSLYLLQLLLCSLSLSLSLYPQWQENNFSRFFFPIWKHQSSNWLASLSFFFFWLAGAPELRVLADREGGGAHKHNPKILSSSFSSQHLWLPKIAKGSTFFFYFSHKRERERERAAPADNPRERTLERSIKSLNFCFLLPFSSCLRRSWTFVYQKTKAPTQFKTTTTRNCCCPSLSLSLSFYWEEFYFVFDNPSVIRMMMALLKAAKLFVSLYN